MLAHELAQKLLDGPNKPVLLDQHFTPALSSEIVVEDYGFSQNNVLLIKPPVDLREGYIRVRIAEGVPNL